MKHYENRQFSCPVEYWDVDIINLEPLIDLIRDLIVGTARAIAILVIIIVIIIKIKNNKKRAETDLDYTTMH